MFQIRMANYLWLFNYIGNTKLSNCSSNTCLFMDLQERFLIGTGGSKLEEAVKRVMEKLLSDEVAVRYSFKGARGKLKFSEYQGIVLSLEGKKMMK